MFVDYGVLRSCTYNKNFTEELSHNWKFPSDERSNLRVITDTQRIELGWFSVTSKVIN